jgi:hypothetical protein
MFVNLTMNLRKKTLLIVNLYLLILIKSFVLFKQSKITFMSFL